MSPGAFVMLKSIDVLISLSVVMLVCSMAVTALTQAISNLINSRGMALKKGIQSLINHLDPALEQQAAGAIADAVLRSPLITDAAGRLGTVIHRDEFTLMLMRLASQPNTPGLDSKVQDDIKALLRKNGIQTAPRS